MSYRSVVTADSPIGWWHLDETVGPTFVDAISARNATVTGTPTFGVTGLTADANKAATFSTAGTIQYGEIATNAVFRPTSFSVEAMVRSRSVTGSNRIFEFGPDNCWALYINSGVLSFTVFGHASATYTWLGDADRHHVVGTYNGATGQAILYVDGVNVGSQTSTSGAPSASTDPLRIGGKPTGSAVTDGWEGTMSEVAFYSAILTPTQVGNHATAAALDAKTLSFAGYTWTKATRGAAAPFVNTFSASQATVDVSGIHVRVDPMGGGYSTGAEITLPSSLGYGTYQCVISGQVSNMHSNLVWGGMFTFGGDTAYGNREIDANEQSKWSGTTATLSHSVWMPSDATNPYAPRGGFNAANNMTTQTASSHTAVMIWAPGRVTMRLYTGTTVTSANLFRESIVYTGEPVTFNIESGGTYTGPATCPIPFDETLHFNIWVCPDFGGGGNPATVTAQELVIQSFSFTPLATLSTSGPLGAAIDWDRSGSFAESYDDVSSVVRNGIVASYGRDQDTALSPIVAGHASFDLDNTTRRYSPRNASSPLFGKLKPARPVLVQRTVSGTTYVIFRGHTDDTPIDPDVDNRRVSISCVDSLADFRGVNITTSLYQGIRSGQAIGYILDAAGWTGGRDIDIGASLFPWWWEEGTDAFSALQKVVYSEGPPALLTIDATGAVVFRDRHHRFVRSASTTSQSTFRGIDSQIEPKMVRGFRYSDAWQNIVNYVVLSVDERRLTGDLVEIWSTQDVLSLNAGEVRTFVIQTTDPFFGAVAPVNGVDYIVLAGSLTSVTISRTSGAATSVTLTAGGSGVTLAEGIALRGYSAPVVRTYQVQATDSASIADYGQRSIPNGQTPEWASLTDTKGIADLLVLQRAQPLPILNVRFNCQHTQTVRLSAVLARDLSDQVTVIEPETQVNSTFFVESISHSILSKVEHEVVFGLEAVPSLPTNVFILDASTLNGSSVLGY